MDDEIQTPYPTAMRQSQAFALKTTRPQQPSGPLSPVPTVMPSKPTIRRVYGSRRSLQGNVSSRNLKENSFHSKSGPKPEENALDLKTKLRTRRTTSFASLKDMKRENGLGDALRNSRKSLRTASQAPLASPFSSRPSSPGANDMMATEVGQSPGASKRSFHPTSHGYDAVIPASKRRSAVTLKPVPASRQNLLPSPIPFRASCSPGAETLFFGQADLHRRPSHPTLGLENPSVRDDDLNFALADVDFNRPPSQMSVYPVAKENLPPGEPSPRLAAGLARADSWTYNETFEADVAGASTPYNPNRLKEAPTSLPNPKKPNPTIGRRASMDSLTSNMSLTSVVEPTAQEADDFSANRTPWITDSLISPPTMYRAQELDGTSAATRNTKHEEVDSAPALNSGLAVLSSDSDLGICPYNDTMMALDDHDGFLLDLKHSPKDGPTQKEVATNPRQPYSRARSGTILAPSPVIASTLVPSRTRSGTMTVAPRTRSGTITPNSASKPLFEPGIGRTRSGTITAPKPYIAKSTSLVPADTDPLTSAAVEAISDEVVDIVVHVDSQYDPTPAEDLDFSPAPNPDVDDDDDIDDARDILCSSGSLPPCTAVAPAPAKASRKIRLPILLSNAQSESTTQRATDDSASKKLRRPRSAPSSNGTGTGTPSGAAGNKPSKRLNLKSALGLTSRPSSAQGSVGKGILKKATEMPASSSDPLDLLSHFEEHDFDRAYAGPPAGLKKKIGRGGKGPSGAR
ncbi:hypothetical protein D9611_006540 [Ephemerocybe angulata]|uniref:Uncharacterized protein n=1 Tax=Ephemerocybe angulata TaxID=980116 RepID=A0A8H5C9B0_9AGAR|nr:hypothetical protein D9611_006540 [Tulosesus angulatus]